MSRHLLALIGSIACMTAMRSPYPTAWPSVGLVLAWVAVFTGIGLWLLWRASRSPSLRGLIAVAIVFWTSTLISYLSFAIYVLLEVGGPRWLRFLISGRVQDLAIIYPQYLFFGRRLTVLGSGPLEPMMADALTMVFWGVVAIGFSSATSPLKTFPVLFVLALLTVVATAAAIAWLTGIRALAI
jgi:hypothetical protein